ncbi:MAG: hypothetical protein QGH11_13865 [Pirellulaceae bacterium]|nr:hypothetical protein [Planctomycetaceae bacterium]MDP7206656.1 hypothetical protein [Pirellulaceae bacterium]
MAGRLGRYQRARWDAVEDAMVVGDLLAPLPHLPGLEHRRLTTRYEVCEMGLTEIQGQVAHGIPCNENSFPANTANLKK